LHLSSVCTEETRIKTGVTRLYSFRRPQERKDILLCCSDMGKVLLLLEAPDILVQSNKP